VKTDVTRCVPGSVKHGETLWLGSIELDVLAVLQVTRDRQLRYALVGHAVRPERKPQLSSQKLGAADVVAVVMRCHQRDWRPALRGLSFRPIEPGSAFVVVGSGRLDEQELAGAERVAVRVRRRQQSRSARRKDFDAFPSNVRAKR
jgi:hypothetical protein